MSRLRKFEGSLHWGLTSQILDQIAEITQMETSEVSYVELTLIIQEPSIGSQGKRVFSFLLAIMMLLANPEKRLKGFIE